MMAIIESPRLLTEISCFHVKQDEGGFPLSCGTTAVNPVTYGCHSRPTPEASYKNNVYIHIMLCMSTLFSYVFTFKKNGVLKRQVIIGVIILLQIMWHQRKLCHMMFTSLKGDLWRNSMKQKHTIFSNIVIEDNWVTVYNVLQSAWE